MHALLFHSGWYNSSAGMLGTGVPLELVPLELDFIELNRGKP